MNNYKAPYKFHSPYWTFDDRGKIGYKSGDTYISINGYRTLLTNKNNSESNYYKECKLDTVYSSIIAIRNKFAKTAAQMINNIDGFKVLDLLTKIHTIDNNDEKEFVWKLQK